MNITRCDNIFIDYNSRQYYLRNRLINSLVTKFEDEFDFLCLIIVYLYLFEVRLIRSWALILIVKTLFTLLIEVYLHIACY